MEFEAQENTLIVSGILDDPNDTEFEERGVEALNAAEGELLIDLTGVEYVGTWHLGRLTLIAMKADAQGKRLQTEAVVTLS